MRRNALSPTLAGARCFKGSQKQPFQDGARSITMFPALTHVWVRSESGYQAAAQLNRTPHGKGSALQAQTLNALVCPPVPQPFPRSFVLA